MLYFCYTLVVLSFARQLAAFYRGLPTLPDFKPELFRFSFTTILLLLARIMGWIDWKVIIIIIYLASELVGNFNNLIQAKYPVPSPAIEDIKKWMSTTLGNLTVCLCAFSPTFPGNFINVALHPRNFGDFTVIQVISLLVSSVLFGTLLAVFIATATTKTNPIVITDVVEPD